MKKCTKCKVTKDLNNFHKRSDRLDGKSNHCKDCHKKSCKQYYEANKNKVLAKTKAYRSNNWKQHLETCKKWNKRNKASKNNSTALRRAKKLAATPKWLSSEDYKKIKNMYKKAKNLEKLDGKKRHVDHIIPLSNPNICGLHVPWNLQILTAKENCSKQNSITNQYS